MDSRVYWIWLAQALQPGCRAAGPLLEHFACAADIHAASEAQLRAGRRFTGCHGASV